MTDIPHHLDDSATPGDCHQADLMSEPKLLPCPFCGTVEMLRPIGASGADGWGFVRCDYCDAEGPDPDNLPGHWNTRADLPRPEDAARIRELEAAAGHARLALAGYVSWQSAVDLLDAVLGERNAP